MSGERRWGFWGLLAVGLLFGDGLLVGVGPLVGLPLGFEVGLLVGFEVGAGSAEATRHGRNAITVASATLTIPARDTRPFDA